MEFSNNRKILIAGGSGFVGKALQKTLAQSGFEVVVLPRSVYQGNDNSLKNLMENVYAVINLAGAPINSRWTKKSRKEILDSRITATTQLRNAVMLCKNPPQYFISASAVGIYDTTGVHDESSDAFSNDFPAEICKSWEAPVEKIKSKTHASIVRLGLVLGKDGGTIKKLLPLFKSGLGGKLGSGKQPFPYIHIQDVCKAVIHILSQSNPSEIYNFTSPQSITNKDFTRALAKALHRPSVFFIPSFILKFLFGKRASMILNGQQVIPRNLLNEGFQFGFADINHQEFFEFR
ncbi:Epimerase family protein [bioreactor metagenome]|uniref:Epimerase family protein n=1 Tax=bioreactor metagenome TaxID=1076179 RepID=A0A644XVK6_9ZZZZ